MPTRPSPLADRPITQNALRRRIALFPGAFQPPHGAHYNAVLELAECNDFDEIVVIISNRSRAIPDTTKGLDAEIAHRIWAIYLKDVERVRVERAPHTAIQHALDYLGRAAQYSSLTYCLGETDRERGDDRFSELSQLASRAGVVANIRIARTASSPIRASELRNALSIGEAAMPFFCDALPRKLSTEERARVWRICLDGMRDEKTIVSDKVRSILWRTNLGPLKNFRQVGSTNLRTFHADGRGGERLVIKHAGDDPNRPPIGLPRSLKPRKRIDVEVAALRFFESVPEIRSRVSFVEYVNRETSTIALSDSLKNRRSLEEELSKGRFSTSHAQEAAAFLTTLQLLDGRSHPFRRNSDADQTHWRRMLEVRGRVAQAAEFSPIRLAVQQLLSASDSSARRRVVHMAFTPGNLGFGGESIHVAQWGSSTSWGDCALDLGSLLGRYLFHGLRNPLRGRDCASAVTQALGLYIERNASDWPLMATRVLPFAGLALLESLAELPTVENCEWRSRVRTTAFSLLLRLPSAADRPCDFLEAVVVQDDSREEAAQTDRNSHPGQLDSERA